MYPRPLRIGVHIPPQHASYAEYRESWLTAEAMGVDVILNWDHFFPLSGDPNGAHFEAWTTLAVLGAELHTAHVGTLVLSIGYRNPALLSAMARTLDHILGGRLILGVGAGWNERDYDEYGYAFGTVGSRLAELERGLEIIVERWKRDVPAPIHGRVPILIGGAGEKVTLRIVARFADMWHTSGPFDRWTRKSDVLDEWCGRLGRDPREIERTVTVSREEIAENGRLDSYVAGGATTVLYEMRDPHDFEAVSALLSWREQRA
jgi:probable F420-dependent oxidoreductase